MTKEVIISHVSIMESATSYNLITLHQFLNKSVLERNSLIKERKVEFLDIDGDKINLIDALRAITGLIKRLREEGKYAEYIKS